MCSPCFRSGQAEPTTSSRAGGAVRTCSHAPAAPAVTSDATQPKSERREITRSPRAGSTSRSLCASPRVVGEDAWWRWAEFGGRGTGRYGNVVTRAVVGEPGRHQHGTTARCMRDGAPVRHLRMRVRSFDFSGPPESGAQWVPYLALRS
jgi:hypothetical protein